MKSTGFVKNVDELGRLVLPKNMRKKLGIEKCGEVEVYVEGDRIILQKHVPTCIFCDSDREIVIFNGKRICAECINSLKNIQ